MTQGGHKRKVPGGEGDEEGESSAFETNGEESSEEEDTCSEMEQKEGEERKREYKCLFNGCGAVFKKVGKLNRHVGTHTGEV